ncbi:MAG TPA: hypothetical protein VIZ66_09665 [Sphingomicrobium sp.]
MGAVFTLCTMLVAAVSCVALAPPAAARDMNAMRGQAVLRDFAKCSVKYEHDLAKAVALGQRGPANMSDDEFRRTFDPRCLGMWGVRLSGTGVALRGALAEELVARDFGGAWPRLDPAKVAPLRWIVPTSVRRGPGAERVSQTDLQKMLLKASRDALVGRLGECVVRRSPGRAVALFRARPESSAEAARLRDLAREVAACVKAGETPDFSGSGLRYAMASAYYRLANAAQLPPVPSAKSPDDLAVQAVHNFGACIVRETPTGAVEQVLALDYQSEEYQKQLRAMAKGHERCIVGGWQLGSSQVLIAGAMAEALLKTEVKANEMPQRIAFDPKRATITARSPTETMALCTAFQAPQATVRLLETEPTSKEETAAVGTIAPVLTQCLKKDTQLTVNKPALRALLALAAWRIVTTPKAPS